VAQQAPPSAVAQQTPPVVAQQAPTTVAQQTPLVGLGTTGCQLPDDEVTSGALASSMTNVNDLQFRNRRV
jgi:hypothetical protein